MQIETSGTAHDVPGARPAKLEDSERRAMIALAAYFRAERRGFAPGKEMEDWLAAERELDSSVLAGVSAAGMTAPAASAPSPAAAISAVAAAGKTAARAPRRGPTRERRS